MKAILRTGFLALAIMALAVPADAGPLENGEAAYYRKDYDEAVKSYHNAAEQGYVVGQRNLGQMYQFGFGVPQDYVQAHMWYNLAATQAPSVGQRRDELAKLLTPDQIAEAQRMAREWMAKHQQ